MRPVPISACETESIFWTAAGGGIPSRTVSRSGEETAASVPVVVPNLLLKSESFCAHRRKFR